MKIGWYKFCRFIKDWIYPAYHLRNFLFHRYDIIKCPQIKPYEYTDVSYLMLCANMELIVKFIEKENPEKHICWYTDEETGEELGHKYGECELYDIMFPEYKGKWVMDIIKEIYNFWKVEYPKYLEDDKYLLYFWCEYFSEIKSHFGYDAKIAKSMDDFPKDINWDIITKYMDKEKLFEKNYVLNKHHELQINIEKYCQKYLHLCIEIRQYLWT
jgi:hypothetical protein